MISTPSKPADPLQDFAKQTGIVENLGTAVEALERIGRQAFFARRANHRRPFFIFIPVPFFLKLLRRVFLVIFPILGFFFAATHLCSHFNLDEFLFPFSRQGLDRAFADKGVGAAWAGFLIKKTHGTPWPGVLRAFAVIVSQQAFLKIFGNAGIERAVLTFKDIKDPGILRDTLPPAGFFFLHPLEHVLIGGFHK